MGWRGTESEQEKGTSRHNGLCLHPLSFLKRDNVPSTQRQGPTRSNSTEGIHPMGPGETRLPHTTRSQTTVLGDLEKDPLLSGSQCSSAMCE